MSFILSGPRIYTEDGVINEAALLVKDGLINAIKPLGAFKNAPAETLFFPSSYHIVPGFIDLHVHGASGHDVMDATPEALLAISMALVAEGTTAYLATTMSADVAKIEKVLMNVRDFTESDAAHSGASILGVHLEGPFLAKSKMGAQRGDKIIPVNVDFIHGWQIVSENAIKLVTLAPEQPASAAFIHFLREHNIIAAFGHTNATYDETIAAIEAGCTHATHVFNAMSGIHHREPGAVTAALLEPSVYAELIVDGVHLHPAIVQLALRVKGASKMVLVTDAMRAKCLADGRYDLGGQIVQVKNGQVRLDDGTLAGSVLKMSSAIQNLIRYTQCDLETAIKMAAENPAKELGLFHKKGSIELGKDADLVVLDEELNVVLTLCHGKIKYQKRVMEKIK